MRNRMILLGALLAIAGPARADKPDKPRAGADKPRADAEPKPTHRHPALAGFRDFDDDAEDDQPIPPGKSLHKLFKSWDVEIARSSDSENVDPVLERFDHALRYAELAGYEQAAAEFEEVARVSGRAVAYYNAAQAHASAATSPLLEDKPREAAQHHREAIAGFRRYLAMVPEARDRANVERSIAREERRLEDLVVADREEMAEEARRKMAVFEQRAGEEQLDDLSETLKDLERLDRERNDFVARLPLENFRYNARVRRGLWIGGAAALSVGVPLLLFSIGNLIALPYHSQRDLGMTVSGSLISGMGLAALAAGLALSFSPQAGLMIVPVPPSSPKPKTARLFFAPAPGGLVVAGLF